MSNKSIVGIIIAVVLTIFIGIFGIIVLIAVPNLTGIRQRSQVSADKRTAEQIGKAVRIWVTDLDTGSNRQLPISPIKYDEIEGVTENYISSGYIAKSLGKRDAYFYVSSIQGDEETDTFDDKVKVAIAENLEDVKNLTSDVVTYDGSAAGWAYIEQ